MPTVKSKPNILIFMTDQEQAQVTLPTHPCRTPNLDKIAAQGVRFTSAYPPMAHCCPARASFMTGLYPSQHGIHNNVRNQQAIHTTLNPDVETFAEKLKEAGYHLYFSGKWHISAVESPKDRGWEELFVKDQESDPGLARRRYREMAYETTERANGELSRPGWGTRRMYGVSGKDFEETSDYHVVQHGIKQIHTLKDSTEPWCMYIGVNGPHDPFIIPQVYADMYDPTQVPLPPNYQDDCLDKPGYYRRMRKLFAQLTEQEVKESIAHYWGFCTMMDDLLGEVLQALGDSGQREETLILFLSDHGEHAGAHGLYAKGISQFDEGYRVPLVISSASYIQDPGRTVDDFITLMDIAPTLIEIADAPQLKACAGVSLVPFLQDKDPASWRDSIYTQCNATELYYTSRAVKTKRYKFVYNPLDVDELYDLEVDPYEMTNIADVPEMAEVKQKMYTRMWEHAFQSEDTIFNQYVTVATAEYGPAIVNKDHSD